MRTEVTTWDARYREDFARLNRAWIEQHFKLEPADVESFADPHGTFVASGGEVFFALVDGKVLGTCALRREPEDGPSQFPSCVTGTGTGPDDSPSRPSFSEDTPRCRAMSR